MAMVQPGGYAFNGEHPGAAAAGGPMPLGMDRMKDFPQIGRHVTGAMYQALTAGNAVRIAGSFQEPPSGARREREFTTTDGTRLTLKPEAGGDLSSLSGYVEVVGTKEADGMLLVVGTVPLSPDFDASVWDEVVRMMHMPSLQHLFAPRP
mmetsp:Transcript_58062/g.138146  ORF Transcript_58062/g.138146 Transcript_58062/m.138146 type:complete len:150 (+) Transcript_58062:78-527(+)